MGCTSSQEMPPPSSSGTKSAAPAAVEKRVVAVAEEKNDITDTATLDKNIQDDAARLKAEAEQEAQADAARLKSEAEAAEAEAARMEAEAEAAEAGAASLKAEVEAEAVAAEVAAAEEVARLKAKAEAAQEEARLKAEAEELAAKAEEEALLEAEAEAAQEEARLKAEAEELAAKAEEEALLEVEAVELAAKAEEQARLKAEEEATATAAKTPTEDTDVNGKVVGSKLFPVQKEDSNKPSRRASSLAVLAPDKVGSVPEMKKGFIKKQGQIRKNWKRRFFVLDKGVLRYYENELPNVPYGQNLKGEVFLRPGMQCFEEGTYLKIEQDKTSDDNEGGRTIVLDIPLFGERGAWILAIIGHIEHDFPGNEVTLENTYQDSMIPKSDYSEGGEIGRRTASTSR